jgi:hypothetical protein
VFQNPLAAFWNRQERRDKAFRLPRPAWLLSRANSLPGIGARQLRFYQQFFGGRLLSNSPDTGCVSAEVILVLWLNGMNADSWRASII